MKKTEFGKRLTLWLGVALLSSLLATSLPAQTPTAEQIDMYKNMSPEQQRAALDALGRSGSPSSSSSNRARSDRQLDFPQLLRDRAGQSDEDEALSESQDNRNPGDIRLKGNDTILLRLQLREDESDEDFDERQNLNPPTTQSEIRPQGVQGNQQQSTSGPNSSGRSAHPTLKRTDQEKKDLENFRDRVQRRNPYRLDQSGVLNVPELGPIPLAGLKVEEAQRRLTADINLKDFKVRVILLPLKPIGTEAVKPFGYDLFKGLPTSFAPATDVPVPAEYVVGPGDTFEVQLIGNTKGTYSLVVGRDGRLSFPELGPLTVSGMRFEEARSMIEKRVSEQMIGTHASITIGELRSIRVFVLGDAMRPGSYTISGLSTITNALFLSGGVKRIGSLRNIELKRNGSTITRLDLYDLLLRGDTRADVRLLPGDVIFVPSIGPTVTISGEVRRPAIYELRGETDAADLINLGGGLTSKADPTIATLERVDENRQRVTVDVNLTASRAHDLKIRNGDVLRVPVIRPSLEDSVTVDGYVYRPGEFQYRKGLRLSDVIPSLDEIKPNGDQHYILIRRELPPDRRITVFSADLAKAIVGKGGTDDIELAPRDRLYVFDLESGRDRIVEPLLRDMKTQSTFAAPTQQVRVGGQVKVPGQYPLEPGMRVSDLIRAGGSLDEAAYSGSAELTRYEVVDGQSREAGLIKIDLPKILEGDKSADIVLRPFDNLLIKETPLWAQQEEVEVQGEVRFPGKYPIHRGETLRSVVERAGGLTNFAFIQGAVFTREELKEREARQLETLANRMQNDIAQASLSVVQETGKDAGQALAAGQSLLASLRNTKAVGRLVIDLRKAQNASPGSDNDVFLKDGDLLKVPRITQEVTVIGEVQGTTSHLYKPDLGRDDYIQLSGGTTPRADKKRIYIVRADGSVVANSGRWFGSGNADVRPGDTIVVPIDAARMRPLPLWTAVTTIIYNLAIAAAAIARF